MKLKNLIVRLRDLNSINYFYWLFVVAVFYRVYSDIEMGRLGIHQGSLFPYRNSFSLKPYPVFILFFEWVLALIGGFWILFDRSRVPLFLISLSFAMGLSQMFQHQKVLFLIVSIILLIDPPKKHTEWSVWCLKNQLLIIYYYSVLSKLLAGFLNGENLEKVISYSSSLPHYEIVQIIFMQIMKNNLHSIISFMVLLLEVLIPICLVKRPRLGIWLAFGLHFLLACFLPNTGPFSVLMLSLAILFLYKKNESILIRE